MKNIPRGVKTTVRSGNSVPATVIDVAGGRVSVRLSDRGAIYRNLGLVGGPVVVGDRVHVDFTTTEPTVVAPGKDYSATFDTFVIPEDEPLPVAPEAMEGMILRYHGSTLMSVHDGDEAGMNEALSVCEEDDLILLPVISLTMDFTVPETITVTGNSRYSSVINGEITLSLNTKLEKLKVWNRTEVDGDISGVVTTGKCNINDCVIYAVVCAVGDAYAVEVSGGVATINNSELSGETMSGDGYAIYVTSGTAKVYESTTYGSTGEYNDETKVYVHGVSEGETIQDCPITLLSSSSYLNLFYYGQVFNGEAHHDMGNVPPETVTVYNLRTDTIQNYITALGMTEDYIWYGWYDAVADELSVSRTDTSGSSSQSLLLSMYESGNGMMAFIDDNTGYWISEFTYDIGNDSYGKIMKFDFTSGSPPSSQEITNWISQDVAIVGGDTWYVGSETNLVKVGSKLVYSSYYEPNITDDWYMHIIVFDTVSDTIVLDDYVLLPHTSSELEYSYVNPLVSDDKVFYVMDIESSVENTDVPAAVVVVDTTALTASVAGELTVDPGQWSTKHAGSAIDLEGGYIYYYAENTNPSPPYHEILRKSTASGDIAWYEPTGDTFIAVSGENNAYLLDDAGTVNLSVYSASPFTIVATITEMPNNAGPAYVVPGHRIDETNGVIWAFSNDLDTIHGYGIDGVLDKTITVTWGGISKPTKVTYVNGYPVVMFMLNGTIVAKIEENWFVMR